MRVTGRDAVTLVLSTFPGIGLLDRAFEAEGFCVVRGPDVLWGGDIRSFHPPAGRFDGVIGGPPCQAFSPLANLVRAKGHEPRFGNLIPEFVRVVKESEARWFLMENVANAPAPEPKGYGIHTFTFCNAALGEEQERLRRFWFGVREGEAPDLRRWIQLAALMLPGRSGTVTQSHIDNSPEAKGRGSGNPRVGGDFGGGWGARKPAVTAAHSGHARPKGGHLVTYQWQEMLRLQGLPPDFLAHAPFTVDGKRKAVANGVPLPMGRAVAKAVRAALASMAAERMESSACE